jgi:hypothetical protein
MMSFLELCFLLFMLPSLAAVAFLAVVYVAPTIFVRAVLRILAKLPAVTRQIVAAGLLAACCYNYRFAAALGAFFGLVHQEQLLRLGLRSTSVYGDVQCEWSSLAQRDNFLKKYHPRDLMAAVLRCIPALNAARRVQVLAHLDQRLDDARRAVQRLRDNVHAAWQKL